MIENILIEKNILAIIPARGGSKGIPLKNIREIANKPLIAYTIEAALGSEYIDRIILSTDNKEIAKVGETFGAELPFMRPRKFATDNATSLSVLQHALNYLRLNEDYFPDVVVELLPTAPLRTSQDIDGALKLFFQEDADTVIGVVKIKQHPYWAMEMDNYRLSPFYLNYEQYTRRQDLPDIFYIAGTITIVKREILMRKKEGLIFEGKILGYEMLQENCVNIDNMLDFLIAETILNEKNYKI